MPQTYPCPACPDDDPGQVPVVRSGGTPQPCPRCGWLPTGPAKRQQRRRRAVVPTGGDGASDGQTGAGATVERPWWAFWRRG